MEDKELMEYLNEKYDRIAEDSTTDEGMLDLEKTLAILREVENHGYERGVAYGSSPEYLGFDIDALPIE